MCRAANFEQELGVIAACQAVGLQFNSTVSAGVGSLFLGTNLILPGRGAPLRFCDTVSRIGAFPEKILLLNVRSQASYTFV